jgi:hypothetical protein
MTPDPGPSLLEELQRLEQRITAACVAQGGPHGLRVRHNERSTLGHGEARAAAVYRASSGA